MDPITGALTIVGNTATAQLSGLAAAEGYHVEATAVRGGVALPCSGSADFAVTEGGFTMVHVVMQCDQQLDAGAASVEADFNVCPHIVTASVTPLNQRLGGTLTFKAQASDANGDSVHLEWRAIGSDAVYIADSQSTTCSHNGPVSYVVQARDSRGCGSLPQTLSATCVGATDGGPPSAACDRCLSEQCNPYQGYEPLLENCMDAQCDAAFVCFQNGHCATDLATVNQCYCGIGVSTEDCLVTGYLATGPCATAANAAIGSTNTQVVLGLLYDPGTSFGNGAALFRCAAELCSSECL
jgi:hypothetical protein